jgi:hypothetical protein
MAKLVLYLDRPVHFPGDTVQGEVVLQTPKPLTIRRVTVEASGAEKTVITESYGSGKSRRTVTYTENNPQVNAGLLLAGPGELPPGEQRFPFSFQMPPNVLATYHGLQASVFYTVRANADIPMWFDAGQALELVVVVPRGLCRPDPTPLGFRSKTADDPARPGFLAQVQRSSFFCGDFVEGSVRLTGTGGHRIRKAQVVLKTMEIATARGHVRENVNVVSKAELPGGELGVERSAPFRIYIPKEAPGCYSGMYSSLKWLVDINLDVAFAFDVSAAQEIVVFNAV